MKLKGLLPIYLAAAVGPIGAVGMVTLLPVLSRNWNIGIQWVSLSITIYLIPFVVFQLFSGSIAQIFNVRKTLLFGFSVYTGGGILCGFSPSMTVLVAARLVQGFGAAFISPIVMALVGEMVEERHLGRAMGYLGMTYTAGMTMGPLISGFLEVHFGWEWFFFFRAALAAGVGVLFWATSEPGRRSETAPGRMFDVLPLVWKAYSYRDVRLLGFAAFSLFLAYMGLMVFVADDLKIRLALPSDRVGFILSMSGIVGIVVSPLAGLLGDRFGRKRVAYAGGAVMVAAVAAMEVVEYTFAAYVLIFAVFGTGAASMWISFNTMAVTVVPHLRKPVASVYNCLKFTGNGLAPLVLSLFYIPFSISGVRWACIVFIAAGLILASHLTLELKMSADKVQPAPP